MGCTLSGLNAIIDAVAVGGAEEIFIGHRRFRVVQQIGEGGYAFVYSVKELEGPRPEKEPEDASHVASDGMYAVKRVLIQGREQLALAEQEIAAQRRFRHPNLLPLLASDLVAAKPKGGARADGRDASREAYLLFPLLREGTLQDWLQWKAGSEPHAGRQLLPTATVLSIFRQVSAGLCHMHMSEPPYAHNDMKPGNVLVSGRGTPAVTAFIMDFGSTTPARRSITNRSEALALQEWAAQYASAPYRAPELWDCPSQAELDARSDIWALGCTLFALMYGQSPFEYALGEAGGSLQLAVMSGQLRWPPPASPPYPPELHALASWMLQTDPARRPWIRDVCAHAEKLEAKLLGGGEE